MQFMADCVVALKLRIVDQIALRYVQVIKYRGSSFAENEAPLVIGASEMEVADISATTVAPEASQARVSSGVERLDNHLPDNHQIEIVDLLQDPRRVLSDHRQASPTLIKLSPAPVRKIIGDLGEETKVLLALGLQQRTT